MIRGTSRDATLIRTELLESDDVTDGPVEDESGAAAVEASSGA